MICEFCKKDFSRQCTLTAHKKTCVQNPNRLKGFCSICGKEIFWKLKICASCKRKYDRENATFVSSLDEAKALNLKWFKFKCPDCGKETVKELRKDTLFKCKSCISKSFQNSFTDEERKEIVQKMYDTKLKKYGNGDFVNSKKREQTCLEKYGVDCCFKSSELRKKAEKTMLEKYGEMHFTNREKAKETMLEKYGGTGTLACDSLKRKVYDTKLKRYGNGNFVNSKKGEQTKKERYGYSFNNILKHRETCIERYGVDSFSKTKEFSQKRKQRYSYDGEKFDSKYELAFWIYEKELGNSIKRNYLTFFEYEHDGHICEYFPDFEIDGKYYEVKGDHLINANGDWVNPFDATQNEKFRLKGECAKKNNVIILKSSDCKKYIDYVNNKYTKDFFTLFKVDLQFPYLCQDLKEKASDQDIIRHFHKSIYEASKDGKLSPLQAWSDKNLLKEVALNRLKYVGSCKASDILQGFSVTRKAPKVSVFRPSLAESLIKKYLNNFDEIVDPFSGFSGRLIGAMNCGKRYIGKDINEKHVAESNEIIKYKNYQNCSVEIEDLLKKDDTETYECLFTCPPYSGKEHWNENNDEVEKSCDGWVDLCLEKYKCKKYLFVVDKTEKYKNYVVENLQDKSGLFSNKHEYVLAIEK